MKTAPPAAFGTFRALMTPERLGLLGLLALLAILVVPLAACGGGGGDGGGAGSPQDPPPPPPPTVTVNGTGRVVLGALGGATVEIYRAGAYGSPVATATTSAAGTLDQIGRFSFTLTGVALDEMFLFVATGGSMRDWNEDGVADGPTPCLGDVHAVASVAEMIGREVRLSTVTDVVYRRARYALTALYDDAHVRKTCDAWASFVLRREIAGGPRIDNDDALAYDPVLHVNATFRSHAELVAYVQRVADGAETAQAAFDLSAPELDFQRYSSQNWRGVEHVNHRAYVCAGPAGLTIWDTTNPAHPTVLGTYDTPGTAVAVKVVWPYAYVADGERGLRILDISNPAVPVLVGALEATGYVADVCVDGNRVYLAETSPNPRMRIVNALDPSALTTINSWAASGTPSSVRVEGDRVYLLEDNQIEVVDATSPGDLVGIGSVPCDGGDMELGQNRLYTVSGGRLQIFSLAGSSTPPQQFGEVWLQGLSSYSVRVVEDRVILGTNLGLAVVDVAEPAYARFEGLIPTSMGVVDMALDDGVFLVATWDGGLGTVAAGTPPPSGVVATYELPAYVSGIAATTDRVVLTTETPEELVVVNTSNPLAPAFLGSTPLATGGGGEVAVVGTRAVVAENSGVQVYDVSNGASPTNLGGTDTGAPFAHLAVGSGGIVYATNGGPLLGVFDVSDPANGLYVRSLPVPGEGLGLAHAGTTLVLAGGYAGLYVFDTTTPGTPVQRSHPALENVRDVAMAGLSYALLTSQVPNRNGGRILVTDCSDPSNPTTAGEVTFPTSTELVVREQSFAYAGWGAGGVNVVSLVDPTDPQPVGTIAVPWPVHYLAVGGGYVYAAGNGYPNAAVHVLRGAMVVVP